MIKIRKYINFVAALSVFANGNIISAMRENVLPHFNVTVDYTSKKLNSLQNYAKQQLNEFNKLAEEQLEEYSKKLDVEFNEVFKQIVSKKKSYIPFISTTGGLITKGKKDKFFSPNEAEREAHSRDKSYEYHGKDLYKIVAGRIADEKIMESNSRRFGSNFFCQIRYDSEALNNADNMGWKIHISPNLLFCSKVFEIVNELHNEMNFSYKIANSLLLYRKLNSLLDSQYGKFITIYPKNDLEAREIVDRLNTMFNEVGLYDDCFLEVPNDFKVYSGIYCRLAYYKYRNIQEEQEDDKYRKKLGINPNLLKKNAEKSNISPENYEHPFHTLYAGNREMPKKVYEINYAVNNPVFIKE